MLNRLSIENFKAWRKADLTFGKVTGFFGSNSAGKSSLLHLLLLLKQTRNATDRGTVLDFGGPDKILNLGSFRDAVHQHEESRTMRWRLDWTLPKKLSIRDPLRQSAGPLFEGTCMQAECRVGLREKRPWPLGLQYRFAGTTFRLDPQEDETKKFTLSTDPANFQFSRNPGRPWPLPPPVKSYLYPSEARSYFQNSSFLSDFELAYEELMDSFYYLGPLREHPRREYRWAGVDPKDVGQRGEHTIDALLAATSLDLKAPRKPGRGKKCRPFQEMIAYWLKELGLIEAFEIREIAPNTNLYQAAVRPSASAPATPLTDVGFGVSQVLPVLVLLYYVPQGATVLLEQPEIHLHPAVQSGLADVMLNVAETQNVQIVVESHSEHMMRRLQRRVAEEKASVEDVKLYFVSSKGGAATVSDLRLNRWGDIENWPRDFFGDEMGEIAAIAEASLRRRTGQER